MSSYDRYPAELPGLIDQFKRVVEQANNHDHHVSRYLAAGELAEKLDLKLVSEGCEKEDVVTALLSYLRYTPKSWQADFNKLLYSGFDAPGVLADWITTLSNATMHTYQVSPVASLMEQEIINALNRLVGFDEGDGIMVSGGTMANMVAMMLARDRQCPNIKEQGFGGQQLVAYVSELAHYSFEKAANVLGIGTQNLVAVDSDDQGCLDPEALEKAIAKSIHEQKQPFFIGLTAGTTVVGSFDPVAQAAAIAREHGIWLHIDGAWGGPVLFSKRHKQLLPDSALADSFTWDAHKLMNVPLTASAILVKDKHALGNACGGGGDAYLFHEDENSAYNFGNKSLQCGRRVDSLKLWLSWKTTGAAGYARKVDRLMALSQYMIKRIDENSALRVLAPANYLNVLFRYEPEPSFSEAYLARLNIDICESMLKQDLGFVDYAQYKGQLGIRFILANGDLSERHIDRFLENCLSIGESIEPQAET
jgi:glutamate/tyrosine decarboxylase-like PLP-dependent enzyme